MKLPLYLGHQSSVTLDDGPSLLVLSPGLVPCRYPLQRISRLILAAGTEMQGNGIIACLKSEIPVTWCKQDGSALAVALPLDCCQQTWAERISMLMARPDWFQYYEVWLAAQQRIALRSLSRRFNRTVENHKHDEWINSLLHYHGIRRTWAMRLMHSWQGMMVSLIVKQWRTLKVPVEMLSSPADGWHMLQDMADCLVLDMLVEIIWRKKVWQRLMSASGREVEFALVQAFERRSQRVQSLAVALHKRFHCWLLEMEPWR